MDFGTVRKKLDGGNYLNLEELEVGRWFFVLRNFPDWSVSGKDGFRIKEQATLRDIFYTWFFANSRKEVAA